MKSTHFIAMALLSAAPWAQALSVDFGEGPANPALCTANADGTGAAVVCNNFSYISQDHGDVAGVVDLSYAAPRLNTGESLRWWAADYNNLFGVAWANGSDGDSLARIEIVALPETSPWAAKYACAPRVRRPDVVDEKPGWVYDTARSTYPVWGLKARPGTAQVFVYPKCKDDRLVADVVRLDKGHTEGLEPGITEDLIRMIVAAPGGKAARGG